MSKKRLTDIKSRWPLMRRLKKQQGPSAVAAFIMGRYFPAVTEKVRKKRPQFDPLKCEEVASDILFQFYKNDCAAVERLDEKRGEFKKLLRKMIRDQLNGLARNKEHTITVEEKPIEPVDQWDLVQDLEQALVDMREKYPKLVRPTISHYIERRTVEEVANEMDLSEDAVKKRLERAREFLGKTLVGYGQSEKVRDKTRESGQPNGE